MEALSVLATWASQHSNLDRIELCVEPWNTSSWCAAERAGYQREVLLRAGEGIGGEPRDMYMYAKLTANALASEAGQKLRQASQ